MSRSDNISSGIVEETSVNWTRGVNTLRNPWGLPIDQFKWGLNLSVRGGIVQTRAGQAMRLSLPAGNLQGCIFFSANKPFQESDVQTSNNQTNIFTQKIYNVDGTVFVGYELNYIVFVVDGNVYYSPFPLVQPKSWSDYKLTSIKLDSDINTVNFVNTIKSSEVDYTGSFNITPSYNVLIIQDGLNNAVYWDGSNTTGSISTEIPIGNIGQFSGNRLWISSGNVLLASDYRDPLSWKERQSGVGRGDLYFDRKITAMTSYLGTDNITSLMVFTDRSTYLLQSSIQNREIWIDTPNFQITLYNDIGCIAPNSIAFQGGVAWWYSAYGLISSDIATTSRLSSQVLYRDSEMVRVSQYFPDDISGICSAAFENYLLVSVPYFETLNSNTMVLDYTPANELKNSSSAAWAGVWTGTRPVNWTIGYIEQAQRLFHCSVDYVATNDSSYNSLWESFVPQREDSFLQIDSDGTTKDIPQRIYCEFETGLLGSSMALKEFEYAIIEAQQISGTVDLKVDFRGSKGKYINILTKQILALNNYYPLSNNEIIQKQINQLGLLSAQHRRLYTNQVQQNNIPSSCETSLPAYIDKGFSIRCSWCGQFGVEAVSVFLAQWSEPSFGLLNQSEQSYCAIGENGLSNVFNLTIVNEQASEKLISNKAFFSTQTQSAQLACDTGKGTTVFATATASFKSYISQQDADAQALILALEYAQQAVNNFRKQNPCNT